MANSAEIFSTGERMMLVLDPAAGTWEAATVDTDKLADITITATNGAVTVTRVTIPDKYPFLVTGDNQMKLRVALSRPILATETVTLDIPASLVADTKRSNATSTDLAVTNNSMAYSTIADLLSASARITYCDPTSGDDTLAAAVNSSDGYYVKGDAAIGSDPQNPTGSVQAYKTWVAADDAARNSTSDSTVNNRNCAVLLKGGELVDGATDYNSTGRVIAPTSGTSPQAPVIYGGYDFGSADGEIRAQQTALGGSKDVAKISGQMDYLVFARGLTLRFGVNASSQEQPAISFTSSNGVTRTSFLCVGVKFIGNVYLGSTSSTFIQNDTGFVGCEFQKPTGTGNGGLITTDSQWGGFPYRNITNINPVFHNAGTDDEFHGPYLKTCVDYDEENAYFYLVPGAGHKFDSCWGIEVYRGVGAKVNMIANVESNGASVMSFPDNRTKLVETGEIPTINKGGYSKWATIHENVISNLLDNTELGSAKNGLIGKLGASYDCTIKNNLAITRSDNSFQGIQVERNGGSNNGYVQEIHDITYENNTVVIDGTGSSQTDGIKINPATSDSFGSSATNQVGCHGLVFRRNIVYTGSSRSGTDEMFSHGTGTTSDTYAESVTAGRADYTLEYNAFYDESGTTNGYRDGDNDELYDTVAEIETSLNTATGTPATGNRSEDPGFTNTSYEISDYLVTDLGYEDLDAAFDAIIAAVRSGTIPTNLTTESISSAVLSKYQPESTDSGNYGGSKPGASSQVPPASSGTVLSRDRSRVGRVR